MFVVGFLLALCANAQPDSQKFDCHPEASANESKCEARGCLWGTNSIQGGPYCYYPQDWGYTLSSTTSKPYGKQYMLKQGKYANPYGQDIETVNVDVIYATNEYVRIRYTDPSNPNRYEPPINLPPIPSSIAANPLYSVSEATNSGGVFGLSFSSIIEDKSTYIGTTAIEGFAFSNQFIQLMFAFNSKYNTSFGWGERYNDFNLPFTFNTTIPGFSRDIGDHQSNRNSYGVHPFLTNTDITSGNTIGIFIANSNAMELATTPYPAIQYRTIGGIIDMFVFFGPTPSDVVSQYWSVIGKPFLPPYWSLGFHLCRFCYNSLNRTRHILEGMVNNRIPYDTQWNDIDYMDHHLDFTYDPTAYEGFPQFVDDIHNKYKMKYVHIIDPGISNNTNYAPFTAGVAADAFVKDINGNILFGIVWPGTTAFPDFWKPSAKQWWAQQAIKWKDVIDYNGWWIDMDEPSNFVIGSISGCPENNQYENPPYYPQSLDSSVLAQKTLCMTGTQYYKGGKTMHYNIHSMYGLSEMIATAYALNQTHGSTQRNFIISRSTYPSAGQYGGHWIGDNVAQFIDMQISISDLIEFNMFGIPMVGTDICGFGGDTTIELCSRWMAVGAFFPFSRNHNTCGAKPQDPPSLGEPVISISRRYLQVRYQILPYLYTLFYEAHVHSKTVMRSFWLNDEFYKDMNTYAIVNQFMLGNGLLISPQVNQNQTTIEAYFPPSARWYEWFTGTELQQTGFIILETPLPSIESIDILPIHVRGGSILPLQDLNGTLTTQQQSVKPYQLLVALDGDNAASGSICIDDGVSIDSVSENKYTFIEFEMEYNDTSLQYKMQNNIVKNGYTSLANNGALNEVKIIGLKASQVTFITITPKTEYKTTYNATSGVLSLSEMTLTINKQFTIMFVVANKVKTMTRK
eukprot:3111_1